MPEQEYLIGIIHQDKDIARLMEDIVGELGFRSASEEFSDIQQEPVRYTQFINQFDPKILVIGIPPPYEPNWEFVSSLIEQEESQDRGFIVTSSNIKLIGQLSSGTKAECLGEPFDIDKFTKALIRICQSCRRPSN